MKREQGREQRWMRALNHQVATALVRHAEAHGLGIALEALTGIRERVRGGKTFNRETAGWAFAELGGFIAYKAALAGVAVTHVDPRHTSQRCPRCGHTARGNRPTQGRFRCQACGYQASADLVGAVNIARKAPAVTG